MSIIALINTFIPFSDPSRSLWRDIILSIIICTFLYFAPQLQTNGAWKSLTDAIRDLIAQQPQDTTENTVRESEALDSGVEAEADLAIDNPDVQANVPDEIDTDSLPSSDEEEEWEQLPPHLQGLDANGAGPANPPAPRPHQPARQRDPNRAVGAKKAKSIARRNQIRAYHEFMREQGDTQRAMDASIAKQRAKEIAVEQHRRAMVEAEIYEREQRERLARKEKETKERAEEAEAIRKVLKIIADGLKENKMVQLATVIAQVDRNLQWAESIIKREGILGLNEEFGKRVLTLLTGHGWIVRVDEDTMSEFYRQVATNTYKASNGASQSIIGWEELGATLGKVISHQHQSAIPP